jgi:hypothetical protein
MPPAARQRLVKDQDSGAWNNRKMFNRESPSVSFRKALRLPVLALCTALLVAACSTGYDPSVGPERDNALAKEQVTRLFQGVKDKDTAALGELLAPTFQLQRTDGDAVTRAEYLAALPDLDSYTVLPVTGLRSDDLLTATYKAKIDFTVNGKKFPGTPVPFLSTFVFIDGSWRLVSHANLGATS